VVVIIPDQPLWMKKGKANREKLNFHISDQNTTFIQKPKSTVNQNKIKTTEPMEISEHVIELWIILRRIAKTVFISTLLVLIIPGMNNGIFTLNPYEPLVLQILNSIIKYTLASLSRGGEVSIYIGSPVAPVMVYLNLAIFIAFLISLPVTLKEIMSFVKPGLNDEEYQTLVNISKYALILFVIGAMISYFIVLPVTFKILVLTGGVIGDQSLLQLYSFDSIIKLLLWGTFGGGILYASPLVLVAMVNLEILTPDQIANRRREIIFIVFLIAAIITPDPTIISMIVLSLPLIIIIEAMISWSYRIQLEKLLK